MNRRNSSRAFTLVELLVVVAVIAILISIAMPAFRGARTGAKTVASQATIVSIGSALETFRAERALGGTYPPSASDADGSPGAARGQINDPYAGSDNAYVQVTGASLLVYALAGPDNRGTGGFSGTGDRWSERMGSQPNSGDFYDPNANATRYGPFAEGKLLESVQPMGDKTPQGEDIGFYRKSRVTSTALWPNLGDFGSISGEARQRFFVDSFDRPILYYRARKSARTMISNPGVSVGVFDHRDNAWLTGGEDHAGSSIAPTVFGQATPRLGTTLYEGDSKFVEKRDQSDPSTLRFDNFIVDKGSLAGAARPVNAESYLLISAGADGAYGTQDDVKNWDN